MAVSNHFAAVFSASGLFLEFQILISKFVLMKITSATTSHPFCHILPFKSELNTIYKPFSDKRQFKFISHSIILLII